VNIKLKQAFQNVDKESWMIINDAKKRFEEKKNDPNQSKSLIDLMFESGLSDEQIRDNVTLFIIAGQETTLSIVGWQISLLAQYPDIQEKARKEIMEKFPDQITSDILKDTVPYLDGFIKESARLNGVPQANGRYTFKQQTMVGNILIPPGFEVSVDMYSMGHDPKIWGDPQNLRPERWFRQNLTKEQKHSYMPFSIGPRQCIGMTFSLLEQKVWLAVMLKKYKSIKLAPNGRVEKRYASLTNSVNFDHLIFDLER